MNDLIKFMLPLAAVGLFACGGGSGVDGTKGIGSLSAEEVASLCEYQLGKGPSAAVDCGDGVTITPSTQAECVTGLSASTSSCTVAQLESCADSGSGDVCADLTTPTAECVAYISCLTGS